MQRFPCVALAGLLLAGATLACSSGAVLAAEAPAPGLGIRLLEAPTARADDPRARVYIVDRIRPGATIRRTFEVTNGDDQPMKLRLYVADAVVQGGDFSVQDFGEPGELPTWGRITPESLTLAPKSRGTAAVTIAVDAKASESEYYGAVVAERLAAPSSTGVGVNLRAAIRVYLSVGPGGEPASDFTLDSLTAARDAAGRPVVTANVTNTGGRALDMSGTLRLTGGPGGLSAGPFNARLGTTLAIGETQPVAVALDEALPNGPWLARLDLASGLVRRSATATITFPDKGAAPPVKADRVEDATHRSWVKIGAGILFALVMLSLFLATRGRRRRG